ncbi:carbohydrate ABC transporter permease [Jannaschia donghaensis]|uniref:Inner membrane ABC transporter permease protein YcjO n=1 Tax=Jannaschia donghaensis TaxID=420998 RepID=A0A0M6YHP7_9RHOB|nr:sugar ABC transporter permease [Jannaschia donghaensis]CTQ49444.1 Inner membrane ABC transporter permease protein YcjO [Jannaschia donghaensis]
MTPDSQPKPPKGLGPLAKREMRFAYMLLLPTFLIVLSVVLFPLVANVWISFKPVTLGDLRAPSILSNERLMGDLEAVGDTADIRYRLRNSSRQSAIASVTFTDTLPASLDVLTVDERCTLEDAALRCDLGDYEPGFREDVIVRVAATQAFLDAPADVKDTDPAFDFVPENILTNDDFTLDNFRKVFNASDFWEVLWASLYYTIAGTVGALVMGLFAAQLMNMTFLGRSVLRGLFLSPYVAPVIAVALAWVLLLDPGPGGTLNALLLQLGVIDGPISFLGQRAAELSILGLTFDFPVALTVVIIFEIWRYFPLAMLFILARMQSVSTDIYEAAEIDGATPLQQFRFISLPQLAGIMAVLFLLRFIWTFNKFDDIFLLTGGAAGTRTLTVNVYEQAFAISNLGAGAAVAVVVFLMLLCFSVIFFKFSPEDDA